MNLSLKLNRKTLILAFACFVLALVTFGIVFVTYFLYTQSISAFSLNPLPIATHLNSDNSNGFRGSRNHDQKQLDLEHLGKSEKASKNRTHFIQQRGDNLPLKLEQGTENDIKSRSFVLSNSKDQGYLDHSGHYNNKQSGGSVRGQTNQNYVVTTKRISTLNSGAKKNDGKYDSKLENSVNINANTETIYIDDYDRPWDSTSVTSVPSVFNSISDQLDINNIDYLESPHDYSVSQGKFFLQKLSLASTPPHADITGLSPTIRTETHGRLRNPPHRHSSEVSGLPEFYRVSTEDHKRAQKKRKRLLSQTLAYQRRQYNLRRYGLVDDDDNYKSHEVPDNESNGSGSGDFIDGSLEPNKHINLVIDDSDVYMAVTGTHLGEYRIQANRRENFHNLKDESSSNAANFTAMNSSKEDSLLVNNSRLHSFSNHHAINGSSLKKWMPPSIVSNRESRLVTPATFRASALSLLSAKPTTILVGNSNIDNESMLTAVDQRQKDQQLDYHLNSGAWLETRARRIMGNVKKSEERSRQLLLCAEAGGGELCRMLFKGHISE